MPISPYLRELRALVGTRRLLVPSAAAAVLDDAGRLLLARHGDPQGLWALPGGAVDPGESPADAAVRETWEELGIDVEPAGVIGVYGGLGFEVTYENGDVASYVLTLFRCVRRGGELRPDGVETVAAAYRTRAEAERLPAPPWLAVALPDIFAGRAEAAFQPPRWTRPGGG